MIHWNPIQKACLSLHFEVFSLCFLVLWEFQVFYLGLWLILGWFWFRVGWDLVALNFPEDPMLRKLSSFQHWPLSTLSRIIATAACVYFWVLYSIVLCILQTLTANCLVVGFSLSRYLFINASISFLVIVLGIFVSFWFNFGRSFVSENL